MSIAGVDVDPSAEPTDDVQFAELRADLGDQGWRYWDLLRAVQAGNVDEYLSEVLADLHTPVPNDEVRFVFSVLSDLLRARGHIVHRDSRLFAAWPSWRGGAGRLAANRAMNAAREFPRLNRSELAAVRHLFAQPLDGQQLGAVMREGAFTLVETSEVHPSGHSYGEAFRLALRYWSMPYRGRSGRMKRFVLTASHPELGSHPVVAGLLELGDEAPFCAWRDRLLALDPRGLETWIGGDHSRALHVAERLRSLRRAVLPLSDGTDLAGWSARQVMSAEATLTARARGRSLVGTHEVDLLKDRKRLIYALRLAAGESALVEYFGSARQTADHLRRLKAGVRAVHDLLVPRLHMEVTVCGALPPFSQALGGKLLVAFFGHPYVVRATITPMGELLSWAFDVDALTAEIVSAGLTAVTTKGLYSKHSPLYHRSQMPGRDGPLRLLHLANTDGNTTSLLSSTSVSAARALLTARAELAPVISPVYGSGGAKRHRVLETAARQVRLPASVVNAGIQRPVYGASLVTNASDICWAGADPEWAINHEASPEEYATMATELWRSVWLERAVQRVRDYVFIPGLPEILEPREGDSV